MNSLFALNGGSLYVGNNIGSASSIYTNGAFVAGPGSTTFGDGFINKNDGALTISASGGVTFAGPASTTFVGQVVAGSVSTTGIGQVSTTQVYADRYNFTGITTRWVGNSALGTVTLTQGTVPWIVVSAGSGVMSLSNAQIAANNALTCATSGTCALGGVTSQFRDGWFSGTVTSTNFIGTNGLFSGTVSSTEFIGMNASFSGTVTSTNFIGTNGLFTGMVSTTNLLASGSVTTTNLFSQNIEALITGDRTIDEIQTVLTNPTPRQIIVRGTQAYVLSEGQFGTDGIDIYDVTDPSNTAGRFSFNLGGGVSRFDVVGDFIYAVNTSSAQIIRLDFRDKSNPSITTYSQPGIINLKAVGRYLYVKAEDPDLSVYEIGEQGNLNLLGTSQHNAFAVETLDVQGSYVYMQGGISSVRIIDVSDPVEPHEVSFVNAGIFTDTIAVQGDYLYAVGNLASETAGASFDVYDISNPTDGFAVTSVHIGVTTTNLFVSGRYAYTAASGGRLIVFDITNSASPVVHTLTTSNGTENFDEVYVEGKYAYVLNSDDAQLHIFDLGGIETNGLIASTAQIGRLDVLSGAHFLNDVDVLGGLAVGINGIHSAGGIIASSFNASATARFINASSTDTSWGTFTNRLAINNVLPYAHVTGASEYAMVVNYNSFAGGGLCLNGSNSAATCPSLGDGISILADDAVSSNAFDLAEIYAVNGTSTPGDLLVLDRTASTTVKVSTGMPYDSGPSASCLRARALFWVGIRVPKLP